MIPISKIFKRYLLIEVEAQHQINRDIMSIIMIRLLSGLFGELGLARIDPKVIMMRENLLIMSCRRDTEQNVRCALLTLNSIYEKKARAKTLKVSGTLKSLKTIIQKNSK